MGYLAYHQLGAPPACLLDHSYIMSAYFRTFLDPPNHNVSICTVLNFSKNCHFLNPFTRLFCWRNKWMVLVLNCPSSNTYRHFTNIPWMNEKKESQFFRPNIHKFFATLKKKHICRMQIMVITQLIKNEFTIFCICLLSDQGCNRKLARPAYGLTKIFR